MTFIDKFCSTTDTSNNKLTNTLTISGGILGIALGAHITPSHNKIKEIASCSFAHVEYATKYYPLTYQEKVVTGLKLATIGLLAGGTLGMGVGSVTEFMLGKIHDSICYDS